MFQEFGYYLESARKMEKDIIHAMKVDVSQNFRISGFSEEKMRCIT